MSFLFKPRIPIPIAHLHRPSLICSIKAQQYQQQHQQTRTASILSSLSDTRGAQSKRIRRGRGPGSGKGKTSGRGHGGQKSRGKPPANFEGGQTPEWIVKGNRGFENMFKENMQELNLDRLQSWIDQGRLNPSMPITMLELLRSGCVSKIGDGIKILARGAECLTTPVHLVVSRASPSAIAQIEAAGGSITTRFYTPFAIAKIVKGEIDPIHSRMFQATPITRIAVPEGRKFPYALPDPIKRKDLEYYRDVNKRGYLSYMVPAGHTPSLFFKTPGAGGARKDKAEVAGRENRLW